MVRHKWFVFVGCCKLGVPLRGVLHDLSKFLPDEWFPYAEYFYGKSNCAEVFDLAWLRHQRRNKHHWQYWVLCEDEGATKVLPMPPKYIKEMLADWRGAGRAITGEDNTPEWYSQNRHKMLLHDSTREWIEEQLFS